MLEALHTDQECISRAGQLVLMGHNMSFITDKA